MTFLQRLERILESKKISKGKLLSDLGINRNAFFDWKNRGTIPAADTVAKIADYLGTTTDYLLGRTFNPFPTTEKLLVNDDPELTEYLEELATRKEMRMLFSLAKGASKADVEAAVKIIEALRGVNKDDVDT